VNSLVSFVACCVEKLQCNKGYRNGPGQKRQASRTQLLYKCCCLLLQYLLQSCSRGGRRVVEDMCHEIRRAEPSAEGDKAVVTPAPDGPGCTSMSAAKRSRGGGSSCHGGGDEGTRST
jgi:hypothetical protein